jgi:hypothetical protein
MDFFDAVNNICKQYPCAAHSEVRNAMEAEINSELERLKGRNKYGRAVGIAHDRIQDWIKTAPEYAVKFDLMGVERRDIVRFVGSHRQACVWAVLFGKLHAEAVENERRLAS